MNNNKQSSVEWLFEMLWDTPKDKFTWHALLEQAKAMHKEEIKKSYTTGFGANLHQAEHYYNETFGGDN